MNNQQLRRGLYPRRQRVEEKAPAKLSIHCSCGTVVSGATKAGLGEAYKLHRSLHHKKEANS